MNRADRILFTAIITIVLGLYIKLWQPGASSPSHAEIWVGNDKRPKIVSLYQHQQLELNGSIGPSKVQVQNNAIRFRQSPCRQQVCVHKGWLRMPGDVSACLPNAISIRVRGTRTLFDAINF